MTPVSPPPAATKRTRAPRGPSTDRKRERASVATLVRRRVSTAVRSLVGSDPSTLSAVGVVGLGAGLSGTLNGYHYSQSAPAALAGWGLGLAVPALILGLARIATGSYTARRYLPFGTALVAGLGLLVLSVGHCAASIGAVTGSSEALALPLAVAIDLGLVAGEIYLASSES